MRRVPLSGPWITQKEIDYVTDAVTNAWYTNHNLYQERFEEAFKAYFDVPYALCLPSGTSAIHLSLAALGVGPGDEVIVPDVTYMSSASPITYVGATTVFADVDPDTLCISAESLEECITPQTKAVIAVDLYGNLPDMDAVLDVAKRHGIEIVEDAVEATGAEYKGKKAGTFGDCGAFGFHGSKTLVTGEGGMLVTEREEVYRRAQILKNQGREPGEKMYRNAEVAFTYRMGNMQAALGLAQVERMDQLIARKRDLFGWYKEELAGVPGLTLLDEPPEQRGTYWLVTAFISEDYGFQKERLVELLSEFNLDCRPVFYPLSSLPAFEHREQAQLARERNRVSYQVTPYGINLPSAMNVTRDEVRHVCDALKGILDQHSRSVSSG